jgi:hypothetical protein
MAVVLQEQIGCNKCETESVHSGVFDYFLCDQKAIRSVKFDYDDLQPTNEEVKLTKVLLCRRKELPESEDDNCNVDSDSDYDDRGASLSMKRQRKNGHSTTSTCTRSKERYVFNANYYYYIIK